jgi:hypothetical protein
MAIVLAALLASPLLMFAAHGVAYRVLAAAGRKPTAHSSAIPALVVTLAVLLGVTCVGGWPDGSSAWTVVGTLAYVFVVFAALSVFYIDLINIAETSLHMHMLLELAWSGGTSVAEMVERYSAERMIATRLERLTSLGQVRVEQGRYRIADRSTLRVARLVDAWRMVLGLPTAPEPRERQ